MNGHRFALSGAVLTALGTGALWWGARRMLVVSDLHLGKSERLARRGGTLLPPYEVRDTLTRLQADIAALDPALVVCLGDTFDDAMAAAALPAEVLDWLSYLRQGRDWIWIAGNHDPVPALAGGIHLPELHEGPVVLRHIAQAGTVGEISGHWHPKARLSLRGQRISRPCFLYDADRVILPAYGTYTGGLWSDGPELSGLMRRDACAVLTGPVAHVIPMPRR